MLLPNLSKTCILEFNLISYKDLKIYLIQFLLIFKLCRQILQNNELQLPAKIDASRKSLSTEPIKKDERINCILVIVNSIEIAASKSSLKDSSKQVGEQIPINYIF